MGAIQRRDVDAVSAREGNGRPRLAPEESIGSLLKQISTDSSHLIQQEIALAKLEVKESVAAVGKTAAQLGVAIGLAIPGLLALTAFLVIGLGDLIDNYWLSALIVGVAFLAVAGIMAKRAMGNLTGRKLGIPETAGTLRDDADWAKQEIKSFKRELTA